MAHTSRRRRKPWRWLACTTGRGVSETCRTRGNVLAMLVSQPFHPLLDALKFRSHPAGFPCCSHGVARRQCRAAGKLFPSHTLAIIEMEPKWNASGSSTHLIGTRHRKPGVDSGRAFWEETDWKQKLAMSQETDMKTARKPMFVTIVGKPSPRTSSARSSHRWKGQQHTRRMRVKRRPIRNEILPRRRRNTNPSEGYSTGFGLIA